MTRRLHLRAALAAAAALAALAAPAARAGDLYSFVDADGVINITNVPSDARYRRVSRTSEVAGLYRPQPQAEAHATPLGRRHEDFDPHVKGAAEKYRLPEALILAVMAVESNFDPRALSDKGAMGLMQLMPGTAKDLYVEDAFDPGRTWCTSRGPPRSTGCPRR